MRNSKSGEKASLISQLLKYNFFQGLERSFLWILKVSVSPPPRHCALRSSHAVPCVLCICVPVRTLRCSLLQGLVFSSCSTLALPFCPTVVLQPHVWALLRSFKQKSYPLPPFRKLIRHNKSNEYKRFSSGFSNLSPLDKRFNTIQTESVQKLFYAIKMGRMFWKCFPSTNFRSQETNIFIVKKKEKNFGRSTGGNWTIFLKDISAICIKGFDPLIASLGIYHKVIIRSGCN